MAGNHEASSLAHPGRKIHECLFNCGKSSPVIQVISFYICDDGHLGLKVQKCPVTFIGLHNKQIT